MRPSKTFLLIFSIVILSAVIDTVRDLRVAGYVTLHTQLVAAFIVFGLNLVVAIVGLWTRFRLGWLAYLVVSACMFLLSSSTPVNAAWILIKLATNRLLA
jgi:lysylphosphatidylglycerol synthetase-like protein (DUF2156 family)